MRHPRRHSRPPSCSAPSGSPACAASRRNRTAPRALVWPGLAGRASEAPPPLPVRHGALKRRVGSAGEPQRWRLRKLGECADGRSALGVRHRLGVLVPAGAHSASGIDSRCWSRAGEAGAGRVGTPAGSAQLLSALCLGVSGCCMKEMGVRAGRKDVVGCSSGVVGEQLERSKDPDWTRVCLVRRVVSVQGGSLRGLGLAPGVGTCPVGSCL